MQTINRSNVIIGASVEIKSITGLVETGVITGTKVHIGYDFKKRNYAIVQVSSPCVDGVFNRNEYLLIK